MHTLTRSLILSRATPLAPLAKKNAKKKTGTKKRNSGRGLGGECGRDVEGKEDTYTPYIPTRSIILSRATLIAPLAKKNATRPRNKRIKFGERVRGRSRERRKTVSAKKKIGSLVPTIKRNKLTSHQKPAVSDRTSKQEQHCVALSSAYLQQKTNTHKNHNAKNNGRFKKNGGFNFQMLG